jgi:predicted MFS family arabinose efflux permease
MTPAVPDPLGTPSEGGSSTIREAGPSTPGELRPSAPNVRAQVWSLRWVFFSLGLVYASWLARIPAFRDSLQLSHEQLGLALLMGGIGSIAAFPVARWLQALRTSRWMSCWMGLCNALALFPIALSHRIEVLMATLFVWGFLTALMDVGMNTHSVKVERYAGRAVISIFHAFFSLGGLAGAVVGALAAQQGWPVTWHFGGIAVLTAAGMLIVRGAMHDYPIEAPRSSGSANTAASATPWVPRWPSRLVVLLGALMLCSFMVEGSVGDWGGIFLRDQLSASLATAPLGFAAFSVAMVAGRLGGDRLRDRYTSAQVLRCAGVLATAGYGFILLSSAVWLALLGFFAVGLGMSVVVPVLFSTAGHLPGAQGERSLAQVTLVGYAAFLVGPPLLGFVAQAAGLQAAFGLLAGLTMVLAVAAHWLPEYRKKPPSEPSP